MGQICAPKFANYGPFTLINKSKTLLYCYPTLNELIWWVGFAVGSRPRSEVLFPGYQVSLSPQKYSRIFISNQYKKDKVQNHSILTFFSIFEFNRSKLSLHGEDIMSQLVCRIYNRKLAAEHTEIRYGFPQAGYVITYWI